MVLVGKWKVFHAEEEENIAKKFRWKLNGGVASIRVGKDCRTSDDT